MFGQINSLSQIFLWNLDYPVNIKKASDIKITKHSLVTITYKITLTKLPAKVSVTELCEEVKILELWSIFIKDDWLNTPQIHYSCDQKHVKRLFQNTACGNGQKRAKRKFTSTNIWKSWDMQIPQVLKIPKFKIKDVYCMISLESMRKLATNCAANKGKNDLSFLAEKGQGNVKTVT